MRNFGDQYAVAVIKDNVIVGHLLGKISRVSYLFINSQADEEALQENL